VTGISGRSPARRRPARPAGTRLGIPRPLVDRPGLNRARTELGVTGVECSCRRAQRPCAGRRARVLCSSGTACRSRPYPPGTPCEDGRRYRPWRRRRGQGRPKDPHPEGHGTTAPAAVRLPVTPGVNRTARSRMRPGHRPGAGRAFLMPAGLSCLNRASGRSRDSDHRRLFTDVHFSTRRFSGAGDRLSAPHRRTAIIRAPGLRRISQVSPHRLCHRADRLGRPSAANGDRWGMARAFRRGLGSFSLVLKV